MPRTLNLVFPHTFVYCEYLSKGSDKYRVSAGQSVQANLVLREKRVISLLTDAVQKALDSLRAIRSKS